MQTCIFVLLAFTYLATTGCNHPVNTSQKIPPTDSTRLLSNQHLSQKNIIIKAEQGDDKIYDLIFNLPEIKEREAYIQQQTHGGRHLKLMIAERPQNKEHNYYFVQAGEENEINFVTHFNFYIYPGNNYEIKFYDTVKDTIISIDDWRKNRK